MSKETLRPVRSVVYARASGTSQRHGIDDQVAWGEALAAREGWQLVATISDEGSPGDGFRRLVDLFEDAAAKDRPVARLICWDTSRLTRGLAAVAVGLVARLAKAGLTPVVLAAKEGLALINGTQVSTALALAGLFRAHRAANAALITGALSTDAAMGSSAPFVAEIHTLRGHRGQIETAAALRALMQGSEIRDSHLEGDERVQDPYCIRCQPQVDGACLDLLRMAARTLETEANAVTDNPLVLSDGAVVSGGNFHAEPVAFAADQIAIAVCEIGAIAQRRVALLVDPALSYGLPAFLSKKPGLNSGLMIAEVTSAALMSENKQMAHPASVDSTPTSANQEDHVSMACHGARRLLPMTDNLFAILGIEALSAVQGVELRGPLKTSPELQKAIAALRAAVPSLEEDRYMAPDLKAAAELIASGALVATISDGILPKLEV